jgi:hypothetical protein
MECLILKSLTSKSMPWADVASMETEAIPTLVAEHVTGLGSASY